MYQQNSCAFTVVDLSGKGIDQYVVSLAATVALYTVITANYSPIG